MRLTLRTLLAWIDGILPAAEHDELGGKVALSPVAPKLVERISLAIESPSLPVPAGSGPADKPNAVAEFLDNVLPAEQLEAFERACLESQVHLADVASCHRLLAEAARDPEKTNPPTGDQRRRLIRAIAEGMSGEPEPSVADELPTAAVTLTIQTNHSRGPTPGTRAAQSPRASVWAWFSAVAAIALMVVLGGILARSIWPPSRGRARGSEIWPRSPRARSLSPTRPRLPWPLRQRQRSSPKQPHNPTQRRLSNRPCPCHRRPRFHRHGKLWCRFP